MIHIDLKFKWPHIPILSMRECFLAKAAIENLWDTIVFNGSNWFVLQITSLSWYFSAKMCFTVKAVLQILWTTMVFYDSYWFEVQMALQFQYFNERVFHCQSCDKKSMRYYSIYWSNWFVDQMTSQFWDQLHQLWYKIFEIQWFSVIHIDLKFNWPHNPRISMRECFLA